MIIKDEWEDMYSEDSVNIPIAESTTVKVETINTEDPLLVTVQSGNQLYFVV